MNTLLLDIRYAFRALRKDPGFTAVVVLTLALGIGANTAIFSVVRGVLLAPLPFPHPDRLVSICEMSETTRGFCVASPPDVTDWSEQSHTIARIGLARGETFTLTDAAGRSGVRGGYATPGYFAALGVTPALGRLFAQGETGPANGHVVVLSDAFWRQHFGADSGVIGRSVQLDGAPYQVIGVLAAGTHVPHLEGVRVWRALPFDPRDESNRGWRGFHVVARLAPGVSIATATRELRDVQRRLAGLHPAADGGWTITMRSLQESVVGGARSTLLLLFGAVGLVLVIACVNVAGLALARATARQPEFALRAALGAGRWPLVRRVVSEGALLGLVSGVLGTAAAVWGVQLFVALAPSGLPRLDEIRIDLPVLGFAVGLGIVTALLATGIPALRIMRVGPSSALREGGDSRVLGARRRTRDVLVACEIGLASMLLVAALLLARSFGHYLTWSPGFEQEHVLTFWSFVSDAEYPTARAVVGAYDRATEALRGLPGVRAVGMTSAGPLFGGEEVEAFRIVGRGAAPADARQVVRWFNVDPQYFTALGVPLRRGRMLASTDVASSPPVVVINEAMARRYWPDADPVGQRITLVDHRETAEVVGVVADIAPFTPGQPPRAELYLPFAQATRLASYVVIRTTGDPATLMRSARARLADAVPGLVVRDVATLPERVGRMLVRPRFTLALVAGFSLVALLLAGIGTYGTIAYLIVRRTREVGVRIALGADPRAVVRLIVRQGMLPVVVGLAAGMVGASVATQSIASLIPGVGPRDAATFVSAAVVLAVVGSVAAYLPARRATRIDPMEALRHE